MFTWDAGKDEVMFPVISKIAYCSKANGINTHCYILCIHYVPGFSFLLSHIKFSTFWLTCSDYHICISENGKQKD